MNIDKMIEQWQEKHSSLLNEYTSTQKMMTEREICECRSHMKNVLVFIEELKQVKNNFVLADVVGRSEQLKAFKQFLQSEYNLPVSNRMLDAFLQTQNS